MTFNLIQYYINFAVEAAMLNILRINE